MSEPRAPAYLSRLVALYVRGTVSPGYHRVLVYHDDWCAIYREPPGVCDCEPEVELPHTRATHRTT